MTYNADMPYGYVTRNTLVSYYNEKYIDDISEYINVKTPYLSLFYTKYPAFRNMCMVDGKQVGIVIPENSVFEFPIFIVHKSVAQEFIEEYEVISETGIALDLCKEILDQQNENPRKIYLEPGIVLSWLFDKEGYDQIFSNSRFTYFLKRNDPDNRIYRLDETALPDKILENERGIFRIRF